MRLLNESHLRVFQTITMSLIRAFYQGWGSKSIIEKIEIFYEIENRKKSKSKKN